MLEQELISAKRSYKKIAEDIFLIEDFIEESDRLKILELAKTGDWSAFGEQKLKEFAEKEHGTSDIEKLLEDGLIEKSSLFDKTLFLTDRVAHIVEKVSLEASKFAPIDCLVHSFDTLQRHMYGQGLEAHVDEFDGLDIKYGVIIYIQQSEAGGEIYFHDLDLSILPPERSFLAFSSKYLHEVKPVFGDRPRYAMTSYYYEIKY